MARTGAEHAKAGPDLLDGAAQAIPLRQDRVVDGVRPRQIGRLQVLEAAEDVADILTGEMRHAAAGIKRIRQRPETAPVMELHHAGPAVRARIAQHPRRILGARADMRMPDRDDLAFRRRAGGHERDGDILRPGMACPVRPVDLRPFEQDMPGFLSARLDEVQNGKTQPRRRGAGRRVHAFRDGNGVDPQVAEVYRVFAKPVFRAERDDRGVAPDAEGRSSEVHAARMDDGDAVAAAEAAGIERGTDTVDQRQKRGKGQRPPGLREKRGRVGRPVRPEAENVAKGGRLARRHGPDVVVAGHPFVLRQEVPGDKHANEFKE